MKPKHHLNQQVVVNMGSGLMIGTIEAAQTVNSVWKYGVRFQGFTHNTPTFVFAKDIVYIYDGKDWIEPSSWATVAKLPKVPGF